MSYILLAGVHPYQQPDDEEMLQQIENGEWPGWKREATWAKISDEAKDIVRGMMNPDAEKRLTIIQCLEHPWLSGKHREGEDLGDIQQALKSYQARKRMKGAILGVMATNKMKGALSGLMAQLKIEPTPETTPVVTVPVVTTPVQPSYTQLTIKLLQGRGLEPKDFNGKSDPYLSIWCGATKHKTKVVPKSLDPVWNETLVLSYSASVKKTLEIECWDQDKLSADEFMGELHIQIDSIPVGEVVNQWYALVPSKKNKGKVSGEIQLEFSKI